MTTVESDEEYLLSDTNISDEEYIPPSKSKSKSKSKNKTKRKRKRKIIDLTDDDEDDDLNKNENENKPLRRKKKSPKKRKLNEFENDFENEETQNIQQYEMEMNEMEMIEMADIIEMQYKQNKQNKNKNKNNNNNNKPQKCLEPNCNSVTICPIYLKQFDIYICRECKWKEQYKCLSKTNAKKQYLLSEGDINSLKCWIKEIKQQQQSMMNNDTNQWIPKYMKLYLKYQLEELSIEKWGSKEGIEAERNRREINKMQRAISNARKKRKIQFECLEDIEIDKKVIDQHDAKTHIHKFNEPKCINQETDEWSKKCIQCGYIETWEEF